MIRVLHVFSANFGQVFSGHNTRWIRQFQQWNDERCEHWVLIPEALRMIKANQVLQPIQDMSSIKLNRWQRAVWALKLWFLLGRYRSAYDILHVHIHQWGGLLSAPLANILGKPCLREINLVGSDNPSVVVKNSLGNIKLWAFRRYDRILCISDALKQDCLLHGFDENRVHVLLNPVDADTFSPEDSDSDIFSKRSKLHVPTESLVFLFVGSVKYRKGVDLLVDAFIALAKSYTNLFLLIIGPDSSQASPGVNDDFVLELKSEIRKTNLDGQVFFTGRVEDDHLLANYYRIADISVFPSRAEGLGNVILESMAAGLPCVVANLPEVTDLIVQDGFNGLLFPAGNLDALVAKMAYLVEDKQRRKQLGSVARAHVVEKHGFLVWQAQLAVIYQSMI